MNLAPLSSWSLRLLSLPLVRRAAARPRALRLWRFERRLAPAAHAWLAKALIVGRARNVDGAAGARRRDFRFELLNPWIEQPLTDLTVRLDGREIAASLLLLDDGRGPVPPSEMGKIRFAANRPLAITARGAALGDGLHFLALRLSGPLATVELPDAPLLAQGGVARLAVEVEAPAPTLSPGDPRFLVHYVPHFLPDADWFADEPTQRALAAGGLQDAARLLEHDDRATFVLTDRDAIEALGGGDAGLLPRLARLTRAGRAEPAMAFAAEPAACWLSGESLVRQAVAWQRLCQRLFGAPSAVAWLPRADGLPASLPQILRKAGCHAVAFAHDAGGGAAPPSVFRWEGIDGARLKAHWLREGPAVGFPISEERDVATPRLEAAARKLAAGAAVGQDLLCPAGSAFGRLPESLSPLLDAAAATSAAFSFAPSLPSHYFATLPERRLPIEKRELPPARTRLARPPLRRLHSQAERALLGAERLPLIAGEPFDPDRRAALAGAWDLLMRAQTRTALSGAHTDAVNQRLTAALQKAQRTAEREAAATLARLADQVRTPVDAIAAVAVANPSGFAREQVVTFDVETVDGRWPALTDGRRRLPYQLLRVTVEGGRQQGRAAFLASLPALGCRVCWLVPESAGLKPAPERARMTASVERLRNGWLTAWLNPVNGAVADLVHRARDRRYPLGDLGVVAAHGESRKGRGDWTFAVERREVVEDGPIIAAVRFQGRLGPHPAALTYRVSQATKALTVEGFVDFVKPCGSLDVRLPRPDGAERILHEIPYGWLARGDGEFPALGFIDLSAKDHGLTFLTDGFAGCRVGPRSLELCVGAGLPRIHEFAAAGAPLLGPCTFRFALFPRDGDAVNAGLHRRAEDFRAPFFVWQGPPGAARGCRAPRSARAALELSTEAIEVGALFYDEDGSTMLRLVERCGRRVGALVRPRWRYRTAELTDLLGRPALTLRPRRWFTRRGELALSFRPFEIKTLRLE